MSITSLTRRMLEAGASPEVISIAVEAVTLASRDSHAGRHADSHVTKRRAADAERQRKRRKILKLQREMEAAQANDGASKPVTSHADSHVTNPEKCCDLTSLSKEDSAVQGSKSRKKEVDGSARGTRLSPDAQLTDQDREFAREFFGRDQIDQIWIEFRDYWIAIPGTRGRKSDWPATWRNRVRDLASKGLKNGQRAGASRTYPASGPAQNGADAILAGMANVARKRGLFEPAGRPGDREIQRPLDLAGGADAERGPTRRGG